MTGRRFRWWLLVPLVVALARAGAQDSAPGRLVLRGEVRDSAKHPIPSAVIRLFGSRSSTTTNRDGKFTLAGLPDRTRVFEILALGFMPRMVAVAMSEDTPPVTVVLARSPVVLDSVRVESKALSMTEPTPTEEKIGRRGDRIMEVELSAPDVVGGNALDAFALLRPRLFLGRPSSGSSATTDASLRGRLFPRDPQATGPGGKGACIGNRACDVDGALSVSVDEGPLGSPDILATLSVRHIKEMRYLLPVEATARFGMAAAGGPVLIVYTK